MIRLSAYKEVSFRHPIQQQQELCIFSIAYLNNVYDKRQGLRHTQNRNQHSQSLSMSYKDSPCLLPKQAPGYL